MTAGRLSLSKDWIETEMVILPPIVVIPAKAGIQSFPSHPTDPVISDSHVGDPLGTVLLFGKAN
jgi:hypothetical protein